MRCTRCSEWCQRFEICSKAKKWNDGLKLPTLLEGEALAVLMELTGDQQKSYTTAKNDQDGARWLRIIGQLPST